MKEIVTPVAMVLLIVLIASLFSYRDSIGQSVPAHPYSTSLEKEGYVVLPPGTPLLQTLPPGYELLDYEYTIRGTSLTTWHRDVTSGRRYHGARYPTYTAIRYDSPGPMLSVVPGSHQTWPFAWEEARTLVIEKPGTIVLFDADLLHAGAPSADAVASRQAVASPPPRKQATQYKIVHHEDRATGNFQHLEGVRATSTEATPSACMRWLSWTFAWVSSTVGAAFQQRKESGWMGAIQELFPQFYNNL